MRFVFALKFNEKYIPETKEFWRLIISGPELLKPSSAGVTEPLKKIAEINPDNFDKEIIWKNGSKCLGYFQPQGFRGKATLSLNLQYNQKDHNKILKSVYEWLHSNFKYSLLYGVTPDEELYKKNVELQQIASCGAIPPDESILINNSHLFEVFEENA